MSSLKLEKLRAVIHRPGPVLFVIMDGLGIREETYGNCVLLASTPQLDCLTHWAKEHNLYTQLKAHGLAVGMPTDKDMGNSEVGHNALGAGRVFNQGAKLVSDAIADRTIFETPIWKKLTNVEEDNSIHFIGLLSDGNVHSHIDHLFAFLEELAHNRIKRVRIHVLLDGRDVPPTSALEYVRPLEEKLLKLNQAYKVDFRIASGGGRMRVTMDRYGSDWGVVKRGWDAHVRGIAETYDRYPGYFKRAEDAVLTARKLDGELTDQYLPSFVIVGEDNKPVGPICRGDSVINFNYRGDRAIQITKAFEYAELDKFDRIDYPIVEYGGLLQYDGDLKLPKQYLVPPPAIDQTIGQYLCSAGVTQYACAETHKYGHVTYFWNGNNSGYIDEQVEKYVEIKSEPSEMIAGHPEMKAHEVCDVVIKALESNKWQFVRVNFANPDMVGHTGNIEAGIRAVQIVDKSIGLLKEVITDRNGIMLVSADHGNVEDLTGKHKTSHTLNPVPFLIWDPNFKGEYTMNREVELPQIANVAATLLNLLGFEKPDEYFESLIRFG